MEILVTGGNGLLGRHLIPELQQRGDTVRALVLPEEQTDWLEQHDVAVYRGNVCDPDSLVEPMRGVGRVFHLAGMMGAWLPMREYRAVNVRGTENVCLAALAAGVDRLVHVSSWTVYGMGLKRPADEEMPFAPFYEPYAVTKTEGEQAVWRFIEREQLPATILRPDTFFGPGDRLHFNRMAEKVRAGRAIVVGSGRNILPFMYVSDVAQGLNLAGDNPHAVGRAYNIAHDRPSTQGEMWGAIADELGVQPPRIHVPYAALYAAAALIERAAILARAKKQPLITRLGVRVFGDNNPHSADRARRELGFVPQVSLREGVRLAAAAFHHQPTALPVAA